MVTTCRILKSLTNHARLKVVTLLIDGDKTAAELNKTLLLDKPLLSHHLKTLRECGVIAVRREGRGVKCRLLLPTSVTDDGTGIDFGLCRLTFGRDYLARESTN